MFNKDLLCASLFAGVGIQSYFLLIMIYLVNISEGLLCTGPCLAAGLQNLREGRQDPYCYKYFFLVIMIKVKVKMTMMT